MILPRKRGESVMDWIKRMNEPDPEALARMETARAQLREMGEDAMGMTCGKCGKFAGMGKWIRLPVSGELPVNEFQCPACGWAVRRVSSGGQVELKPIQGRL